MRAHWPTALCCLQAAAAHVNTLLRYVNPLSIENTRSIADPAAMKFGDKYYLFLTGGLVWSSG